MYNPKPRWTARQTNFLIENWDRLKDDEIAEVLGKTQKSIRRKRERLELKKGFGRGIVIRHSNQQRNASENNVVE